MRPVILPYSQRGGVKMPTITGDDDRPACGMCAVSSALDSSRLTYYHRCKRSFSKYTCPKCNVPYCSLICYRSEAHTQCTEPFYKREVEDQIKAGSSTSTEEEKRQMLELLKRFEMENMSEGEGGSDDNEDEDSDTEGVGELAKKLQGVDLDTVDPEEILMLLSSAQRQEFMAMIRDPSSRRAQSLLANNDATVPPWWEASALDAGNLDLPLITIPPGLLSKGPPSGKSLIHNVFALCVAYCYTARTLGVPQLSDIPSSESNMARDLLSQTAPFLVDRKSTIVFTNVDTAWTYIVSRLIDITPGLLRILLQDSLAILRPLKINTVTTHSESESATSPINELDISPLRRTYTMLTDVSHIFAQASATKQNPVTHKIAFYAAHVDGHYRHELGAEGWDLMIKVIEMKLQELGPKAEVKEQLIKLDVVERVRSERRPEAFIEEI
ncbi:hypothetical protein FRB93_001068 [Tulasnella sp. JGI-2019a]|nr:hypothetical protein FRB93_001068 [Tulasnella sp. JGI-2019a]